jgi:hypothetical protein
MTDGLNLLELGDLPSAWRAILRLLMREQPLSYAALVAALEKLPAGQQMQGDSLDEVLAEMMVRGYLIQQVVDGSRLFSAKIARKTGRAMSGSVWDALESTEGVDREPPPKADSEPPRRRARGNLWDSLG